MYTFLDTTCIYIYFLPCYFFQRPHDMSWYAYVEKPEECAKIIDHYRPLGMHLLL